MDNKELDLKEITEMIVALTELGKAGKKIRDILKEGFDMTKAISLISEQIANTDIYIAAAKDADKIKAELMDLSKEELIELFLKVTAAISAVEKV